MSMPNKYPIYVISKDRYDCCFTPMYLEAMKVPYRIVVEPCDYEKYAAVIAKEKILVLPFENLGQGSIPARNWVWEHSIAEGHERHWILDDNIKGFYRLNGNRKHHVQSGSIFYIAEQFVDRYENVAMAGFNYEHFGVQTEVVKPFYLNSRIYSCILLLNKLPERWRGRYNEDTDLSLRVLKSGWCTILFNWVLAKKMTTMTMKGGNTDHVYTDGDKRLKFVQSLQEQHPDVVELTWKFGRWHHQVNYHPFRKNRLIKKPGVHVPKRVNEFGVIRKHLSEVPEWKTSLILSRLKEL